jgi:hypothetical protein
MTTLTTGHPGPPKEESAMHPRPRRPGHPERPTGAAAPASVETGEGTAVAAPDAPDAAGADQPEADARATDHDGPTVPGFDELGLDPGLVAALGELGYEEPTPIQAGAIPPLIAGRDLLGRAATGTGKTAAFALPILQTLATRPHRDAPMALVLVPTRELAMQVAEAIHRYGRSLGARVLPIFGGQPIGRQLQTLSRGVDVVVATPGGRSTTQAGLPAAGRAEGRGARRGRRDARHGLLRGHRGDPRSHARRPSDGAVLRHDAVAHRQARQAPPDRSGAHRDPVGAARAR